MDAVRRDAFCKMNSIKQGNYQTRNLHREIISELFPGIKQYQQ